MSGVKTQIKHHPLQTFFALCFALSWSLWIPLMIFRDEIPGSVGFTLLLLGSLVPSGVAIILTAIARGKGAVRTLLGRLLIWRIGVRWYLVLLVPTLLVIAAITINAVLWGGPHAALGVAPLAAIVTVAFMIFPGSAAGEEIGWRGYALPRLQSRRSALTASLILGTVHALWHLPLWLRGLATSPLSLYPAFVIQVIAYAIIYTWLYNSTRGSLLLVVLFHAATNAPLTLILLPLGNGGLPLTFWLISGLTLLWAVLIVALFGTANLSRNDRQQPDTPTTALPRDPALDFQPK